MPEKPLTVASYAAGASLAAITLVYIFGPTFFLDEQTQFPRKQGVVGLSNPANDCFINSVLQALAGIGDLRVYLIQELYRRHTGKQDLYLAPRQNGNGIEHSPGQLRRLQGLLDATATQALKSMLDKLNERPLYAKTISARPFIAGLEQAFNTRLNRQQQDAQELLQLVLERLDDEYEAGMKARQDAGQSASPGLSAKDCGSEEKADDGLGCPSTPEESAFPFQGKTETFIECQTCRFTPKSNASKFFTLTLNVPQSSSTTLDACFDGLTKQEFIDDYRCDRCRLTHAVSVKNATLACTTSTRERDNLSSDIAALEQAIRSDPEKPPDDVILPDTKTMPRRRISKHTRISQYPRTLAIHLSRSIYGPSSFSQKNTSRVAFPEHLVLGNLSDRELEKVGGRHKYRLLALVTHHGVHNSGHYETFRRQIMDTPGLRPKSLDPDRRGSVLSSEQHVPNTPPALRLNDSPSLHEPDTKTSDDMDTQQENSTPTPAETASPPLSGLRSKLSAPRSLISLAREQDKAQEKSQRDARRKKKREADKWWRMSDEKIKECRTSAVLGMQRDAYLLFYELDE